MASTILPHGTIFLVLRRVGGESGDPTGIPKWISLEPGKKLVLGRDSVHADLAIPDESVSRRHAEISNGAPGVAVRDLGSTNGVRVNGVPCAIKALEVGDIVSFGVVSFLVSREVPRRKRNPHSPDSERLY